MVHGYSCDCQSELNQFVIFALNWSFQHSDDASIEEVCSPAIPFHKQAKTYRAPVQETVFNPLH